MRRARELYWVTQDGKGPTLREDGTVETNGSIRFITHRGAQIAVWVPAHNTPELLE